MLYFDIFQLHSNVDMGYVYQHILISPKSTQTSATFCHHLFRQQRLACGTICNLGLWEALHCPMKRKGESHANEHQQLQEPWLLEKVRWISRISHIFDLVRKLVCDASKSDHGQEWQNEGSFVHHGTWQHSNRSALVHPRSMCRRDPKGPFWALLLNAELHMVTYCCKVRLEVWCFKLCLGFSAKLVGDMDISSGTLLWNQSQNLLSGLLSGA